MAALFIKLMPGIVALQERLDERDVCAHQQQVNSADWEIVAGRRDIRIQVYTGYCREQNVHFAL